jgi:hypothetical protein
MMTTAQSLVRNDDVQRIREVRKVMHKNEDEFLPCAHDALPSGLTLN